ncbi:unnamed protein product [Porites lobata]|uniref:Uncharacterized protein n=1 Tax=Porites lobata TaxID=104759 RepID=A0ABN8N6Y3_9CNID|nr:unnamed protein product [Porites lobata]
MQYCAVKPPGLQNSTKCSKTKGATFTPASSTSSIFMPDEDTKSGGDDEHRMENGWITL